MGYIINIYGTTQIGKGVPVRYPPPPPGGSPYTPYIIPLGGEGSGFPRGGLPGPGLELDLPLGPLFVTSRAGHASGPGGG